MNVNVAGKTMMGATKALSLKWELTKQTWHDTKAQQFETEYILELDAAVNRAGVALEKLDQMLSQIQQDCE